MLNSEGELAETQPITMQDWGLAAGSLVGFLLIGRFLWSWRGRPEIREPAE